MLIESNPRLFSAWIGFTYCRTSQNIEITLPCLSFYWVTNFFLRRPHSIHDSYKEKKGKQNFFFFLLFIRVIRKYSSLTIPYIHHSPSPLSFFSKSTSCKDLSIISQTNATGECLCHATQWTSTTNRFPTRYSEHEYSWVSKGTYKPNFHQ